MFLKQLSLVNYKNIDQKTFDFQEKINCFIGKNGIGKTTVLDAIYHLAFGKSYFNPIATQNIKHQEDFFVIDGVFSKNANDEKIVCSFKKGQKKVIKRNGKIYEKLSEHVGFIPVVIISPADTDLIVEGSETRRRFLDTVISSLDNTYLNQLIYYQKLIAQRNALLKYFALNQVFDPINLTVYDEQLLPLAKELFEKRLQFIQQFIPIFKKYYSQITEDAEQVNIKYESQLLSFNYVEIFEQSLQKDRFSQYTNVGIHKDDLLFEMNNYPVKKYGSQGQQKSFLIALKLAQFEFIKTKSGVLPLLLFDDIFDKLDANRVQQIITLVNQKTFGQLFITDTHEDRTEMIVKQTSTGYQIFRL